MYKDFIFIVFFASMLSIAIAYYSINLWLQTFSSKVSIDISVFVYGTSISLLILLFVILLFMITSKRINIISTLNYE